MSFGAEQEPAEFRLGLALGLLAREGATVDSVAAAVGVDPQDLRDAHQRVAASMGADAVPPAPSPMLSVVLPMLDEESNVDALFEALLPVLAEIGTYEVIVVDDGSTDTSPAKVLAWRDRDPAIRLIQLSRNFGHQAALTAGIDLADGDAVVLMDSDLQDPPLVLHELIERWRSGTQVVYAVRRNRKEGPLRRMAYFTFYRLMRRLANISVPVDSGDFCLMDRSVVDVLVSLPERGRYLRGLRSWVGFKQEGIEYERSARHAGPPKYTFRKLIRLALDGLLSFSSVPLRMASFLGFLVAAGGLLYFLWAVYARIVSGSVPDGWTSIVLIQLVLGGAQLIVIGVVGEYVARAYDETKGRPVYVIAALHGFDSSRMEPTPLGAWSRRAIEATTDG